MSKKREKGDSYTQNHGSILTKVNTKNAK